MSELLSEVILLGLVVWRVSNALHYEDGPGGVFFKVREYFYSHFDSGSAPSSILGAVAYLLFQAITCFSCTITVAAGGISALTSDGWVRFFIAWLGISAIARFMDYLIVPPVEGETEEVPHG